PGSEEAKQIGQVIERVDGEIAQRAAAASAGGGAASAGGGAATAQGGVQGQPAPGAAAARIDGTVRISEALARIAPAGATLYVIAREAGGASVPVAVLRVPSARLPRRFELSDVHAMSPERPLSKVATVVVEARLSASGDAMRRPGDLIGRSAAAPV